MRLALSALLIFVASASNAQQADSARLASRPYFVADVAKFAVAAGLPDLEVGPHAAGDREVRVWVGFGLGWPQNLYRLRERGGRISGEYIRYWERTDPATAPDSMDFAALMRYYERGRCGPIKSSPDAETCVAQLRAAPPWARIWHAVDSLGVWTLPDEHSLKGGNLTFDGWGIAVETWDGAAYRSWSYSNPNSQPWPEAKIAARIASAFDTVGLLMKRSAGERPYRGRVITRADTLEFWSCDGSGPWMIDGRLDSLIAITGRGDTTLPYRVTAPYYVEAIAIPTPEFVVRQWWHVSAYYVGALEADTFRKVRPWAPEMCR